MFRNLSLLLIICMAAYGCITIQRPPVAADTSTTKSKTDDVKAVNNQKSAMDKASVARVPSDNNQEKETQKSKTKAKIDKANQFARDGLYREAINAFRDILDKEPDHIESKRTLGILLVKIGQYKEAIKILEKVARSLASDFESNYYLAEAYRTQDQYADAIFHYKIALSSNPDHIQTMKALAWSYYQIRYYKAAFDVARRLRKLASGDVQIDIILARILNKMGNPKVALSLTKKSIVLAKKGEIPYLHSVLGDIYYNLDDFKLAEESYRSALKDQPLLAGALMGLAKCMLKNDSNTELARTYLERAIRLKPKLIEAYYYLALSYEKSDPEKSQKFLVHFIKEASGDPAFLRQVMDTKEKLSALKKTNPKKNNFDDLNSF